MGGKAITWSDQAQADLRAIDQPTALRILNRLAHYLASGAGDVKQLQGVQPPELRLRIGDYRLRFYDLSDSIVVLAVKHRREAYR
jgi:mRNA interferase RelE/StbE